MEHSVAAAETPESPDDLIYIRNLSLPDSPPAKQTRAAFDAHFKGAGFVVTDDAGNPLTAKTKTPVGGAA